MRRLILPCATIVALVLVANLATAQMCQHRGGSSRGMSPYSMNMPYYPLGYANYYPNYYPGYYPNNYYPNYYPNYYANASSFIGTSQSQQGQSAPVERGEAAKAKFKLRVSDPKSQAKAEKLIAAKLDEKRAAELVKKSLGEIPSKLN